MTYIRHPKIKAKKPKANSSSLLFLFVTSALITLTVIIPVVLHGFWEKSPISYPIGSVAAEALNPLQRSLAGPSIIKKVLQKTTTVIQAASETPEAHLKISSIGVDAVIKDMGVTSTGAMAIPGNRADVGWYGLGTRPGQTGSAVIGGHNFWNSGAGVFAHLNQLEKGDTLTVIDAKGISTSFVVREMRTFAATDTNSGIFQSESGIHLNLITCSGTWDPLTKSFTTRLVVFTDAV